MKAFILIVTWFYCGQPPATSQTVFNGGVYGCAGRPTAQEAIAKDWIAAYHKYYEAR